MVSVPTSKLCVLVFGWRAAVDRLGVVATRPVPRRDGDDWWDLATTHIVGEQAPIDVHARRQVGADQREVAGNREQRPLGLADTVARDRVEQPHRVRVAGAIEHLLDRSLFDDASGVHDAHAVAHRADDAHVVGDQQDRGPRLAAQVADEVEHLGLDGRVEAGRRLVEHEQLRIAGQRHRDHDSLEHAAGQLVRIAIEHPVGVGDLHVPQGVARTCQRLRLRLAEDAEATRRPDDRS